MSSLSAPDQTASQPVPQPAEPRYLAILNQLAEISLQLATALQANAMTQVHIADTLAEPVPEASVAAFDRAARCVRRTALVLRHVTRLQGEGAPGRAHARTHARKRILRAVQDSIGQQADTDEQAERLNRELVERLDSTELDDDIAQLTLPEIIQDIARDLGLAAAAGLPPAMRRHPADVAALAAWAAAPPGTPADSLPPLAAPRAWGGLVLDHPDDKIEYAEMTDAQLAAAMVREAARARLNSG